MCTSVPWPNSHLKSYRPQGRPTQLTEGLQNPLPQTSLPVLRPPSSEEAWAVQASEADKSYHLVSDELVFGSSHQRQTAGHVQLDLRSTCRDCQGIDSSHFLTPQRERGQGRFWAGHWECSLPCVFYQRLLCADGLMREAHYMYCRTAALQASIRSAPQIVSPLQQYLPALRLCSQHHCMRKQEHALSSGTHMAIMQLCQAEHACMPLLEQAVCTHGK